MADTKISALTGATTPLAGTEVVPLVQSSTTKNVSVANLTAGRAVSASTLSLSSSAGSNNLVVERATVGGFAVTADTGGAVLSPTIVEGIQFYDKAVSVRAAKLWTDTGNLNLYTGNLVIGTSGKGIDFSATSDAAGMTSELLDDYEEGTWTPVAADAVSGGNTGTAASALGTYTKTGDVVFITGLLVNINTAGMTAGNTFYIQGLPFTSKDIAGATAYYTGGAAYVSSITVSSIPIPFLQDNGFSAFPFVDTGGNIIVSDITSGSGDIYFSFSYKAN